MFVKSSTLLWTVVAGLASRLENGTLTYVNGGLSNSTLRSVVEGDTRVFVKHHLVVPMRDDHDFAFAGKVLRLSAI